MLLEHGHTSKALESGRVTIEDAFLLLEDMKDLFNKMAWAEDRLHNHYERDSKRRDEGLITDTERFLNGQKIHD